MVTRNTFRLAFRPIYCISKNRHLHHFQNLRFYLQPKQQHHLIKKLRQKCKTPRNFFWSGLFGKTMTHYFWKADTLISQEKHSLLSGANSQSHSGPHTWLTRFPKGF